MHYMLSWFDLSDGETIEDFRPDYIAFVEQMQKLELVVSTSPLGVRESDTPMDTDDERSQQYFSTMTFRDRNQLDAAYAHMMKHPEPEESTHRSMLNRVVNPRFICWKDID